MPAEGYKYHRVLLKLSGEALMGDAGYGIDPKVIDDLAEQIKEIVDDGVQVAITVGVAPTAWTEPRPTTSACWQP